MLLGVMAGNVKLEGLEVAWENSNWVLVKDSNSSAGTGGVGRARNESSGMSVALTKQDKGNSGMK